MEKKEDRKDDRKTLSCFSREKKDTRLLRTRLCCRCFFRRGYEKGKKGKNYETRLFGVCGPGTLSQFGRVLVVPTSVLVFQIAPGVGY